MSELKVNTISEVTGANGVVVDSVKLKDGGVIIADAGNIGSASDTDAIAIASGGEVTFSQAATFSSTIQGTSITATTAFVPDASDGAALGTTALEFSDLFLADGAVIGLGDDQEVTLTHVADTGLTLNSTNKLMFNDASQFIQGTSATVLSIGATDEIDLTATTVDLNGTLNVSGVATFQAAPVFPDGSLALADLDIDGGTDIGAAIVDADLFIVDDGAGGTNRKTAASRLKTYIGTGNTPSFFARGAAATAVANATLAKIACRDEIVDNGGCYNATSSSATLNSLTAPADTFTPNVAGLYFFVGAIQLNTTNFNVGLVNNIGGTGGSETYVSLVYRKSDTANGMVMVAGYSNMNGTGNNVSLTGYQESGGSINTNDSFYTTYFGGFLVKAS